MSLVSIRVAVGFQIGKSEPTTLRSLEIFILLVPFEAQWKQDLFCALYQFHQFGTLTAERQSDGILLVGEFVVYPVPDNRVRFATSSGPTEPNVIGRTLDELGLLGLRGPDSNRFRQIEKFPLGPL